MSELTEKMALIIGSRADYRVVQQGLRLLKGLDVPCRALLASTLKVDAVRGFVEDADQAGVEVFIVAQGGSATLPGLVASLTTRPVIGVPLDTTRERGHDARQAMGQPPAGAEILMTGINGIESAIYAALRILALSDPAYFALFNQWREHLKSELEAEAKELEVDFNQLSSPAALVNLSTPAESSCAPAPTSAPASAATSTPQPASSPTEASAKADEQSANPARTNKSTLRINTEHPNIEYVEEAVHALLGGKIIAVPTDTVYGLAVDATNTLAVKHLRELKTRRHNHALPVMVCNEMQLKRLVHLPPEPVLNRLDDFWPGPLTIVFNKPQGALSQVSLDDSLGVRIPNHNVTLGILSMINRPLAVTSANPTGEAPATTAELVRKYFPKELALIIDSGPSPVTEASTVIDVRNEPYKIIRNGLTSHERLRELFGRLVE